MSDSVESLFAGSRKSKKHSQGRPDGRYSPPFSRENNTPTAKSRPNTRGPKPQYTRGTERLPAHVEELRALMADAGVLIVSYITDRDSRTLLHGVHLESRGLMLPQNSKAIHDSIVSGARGFYEVALKDIPDIEMRDLGRLLKQDIEKHFRELLDRTPCVVVLIHQL